MYLHWTLAKRNASFRGAENFRANKSPRVAVRQRQAIGSSTLSCHKGNLQTPANHKPIRRQARQDSVNPCVVWRTDRPHQLLELKRTGGFKSESLQQGGMRLNDREWESLRQGNVGLWHLENRIRELDVRELCDRGSIDVASAIHRLDAARHGLRGSIKIALRQALSANGALYETTNYPFLLRLSKHEWTILRGPLKYEISITLANGLVEQNTIRSFP